jgi:3-hydroxybutyryl-CoA dehydratase
MTRRYFFEDLQIGQTATPSKMITEEDVLMYSLVSLDTTPFTWTKSPTCHSRFGGRISHGMLPAGLISALLGTRLPEPARSTCSNHSLSARR